MRSFAEQNPKQDIRYIEASSKLCDVRNLIPALRAEGVALIRTIDPVDDWLSKRLKKACKKAGIQLELLESSMFLNSSQDLSVFFRSEKKKFFQTAFYKEQRKKRNVLIEADGSPTGGKWSFDADNRKKYRKGKQPPYWNADSHLG